MLGKYVKLKTAANKTVTNFFEKDPTVLPLAYISFFVFIGRSQSN